MRQGRTQRIDDPYPANGLSNTGWREDEVAPAGLHRLGLVQPVPDGLRGRRVAVLEDARSEHRLEAFPVAPELECAAPQRTMKIADFVENVFVPELVAMRNLSGRTHYKAILKHVLTPKSVDRAFQIDAATSRTRLTAVPNWPYLDDLPLCDARPDDVQKLIAAASAHGYSSQTATHIRSTVCTIFALAKKKRWFTGDNPASGVRLPEMIRKESHALTLGQVEEVLGVMRYPEKEVALIMILTGMNVAEICGLQWKYVNPADTWSNADGDSIPPRTIAVRRQWRLGQLETLGKQSRNRTLPIPEQVSPILAGFSQRANFVGPDDFVLVTPAGRPIGAKQIAAYRLKAIGRKVQMPWLSWHVFHRTHTAFAYQFGMQFLERVTFIPQSEPRLIAALESRDGVASSFPPACRVGDFEPRSNSLHGPLNSRVGRLRFDENPASHAPLYCRNTPQEHSRLRTAEPHSSAR